MTHTNWTPINFNANTRSAFSFILKNNTANNAPYHNFYHIITVTKNCYEASLFYNLDNTETENLLIAALFHDFNHSMGKEKDNINIQRALIGLNEWVDIQKANVDIQAIRTILQATEYPYLFSSDKASLSQQIIRDADLTQYMEDNWIQQIIFGLSTEMGISPSKMLDGQKEFLSGIEPATKWFEQKWSENKGRVLSKLEELRTVYNL